MVCPTGDLSDLVVVTSQPDFTRPILLLAHKPDSKLALIVFAAGKHFAVEVQERGVVSSAGDVLDLHSEVLD